MKPTDVRVVRPPVSHAASDKPDHDDATRPASAHAPETVEGWYALHQLFSSEDLSRREGKGAERAPAIASAVRALTAESRGSGGEAGGWSAVVQLIGSDASVMLVHLRPTLNAIGEVQRRLEREPLFRWLTPRYSFLSVTEAGLYHLTAELAREAAARGGSVGDDAYRARIAERVREERETAHVRKRLYPPLPADMPYVCFYPMSKRRSPGQNWYALSLEERSRLMQAHGATGRRYAGRVQQIITGAIGLDAWEWGVTLFGRDPLDFKKLVTDMRFDEVSARYADFGEFHVGRVITPEEWGASLTGT